MILSLSVVFAVEQAYAWNDWLQSLVGLCVELSKL